MGEADFYTPPSDFRDGPDDPQLGLITKPVTVTIMPREDGGIRVQCEELPGLILSSKNVSGVMAGILPCVKALREYPAIRKGEA